MGKYKFLREIMGLKSSPGPVRPTKTKPVRTTEAGKQKIIAQSTALPAAAATGVEGGEGEGEEEDEADASKQQGGSCWNGLQFYLLWLPLAAAAVGILVAALNERYPEILQLN